MCKMFGVRILRNRDSLMLSKSMKIKYIRGYSSLTSGNSMKADNKCDTTYERIADFYSGKSVFMTGGTGFLGKVYLEKLLYSCNKLDKVYLLVRQKNGENVNKRIEDLFANPLFARLKKSKPDYIKKVVPVTGDVSLPNLGLSPKDEQTLIEKVSVVYHGAATVRFDEPLPVAMNINFEGSLRILELSRRMKNMEAFVYISTAYTQAQRKVLVETVYPPPAKVEDVYKFMEEYGHDTDKTNKYLSDHEKPNAYTFTKSLSESYITKNHGDVPTVIIRPSIVAPIKDEPIRGWLDNWFGATPALVYSGKGWNRFNLGTSSHAVDFIPVDYVSNLSIIAGARAKSSKVQVFNSTTSSENPVIWADIHKYFNQEMVSRGLNEMPYPSMCIVKSKAILHMATFLLQTTPAHMLDLWLKLTGKKPKYAKLVAAVVKERNALNEKFSCNSWVMRAERARELFSSLSPEDQQTFPCDPTQIDWPEYFRDYCKESIGSSGTVVTTATVAPVKENIVRKPTCTINKTFNVMCHPPTRTGPAWWTTAHSLSSRGGLSPSSGNIIG